MPITGTSIVSHARDTLFDPAGQRWTDQDMIRYLNAASVEITGIVPTAYSVRENVTLVPGAEQDIPVGGFMFLNMTHNVGGRAVRRVSLPDMDAGHPGWRQATPTETGVRQFMFDDDTPRKFFVYPPAAGSEEVGIVYAATPPAITALADTLPLPEAYQNAYINYVIYRAYARDADYAANQELATWYFQQFAQGLGVRFESRQQESPNRRSTA